jgi:hypothetical protein
MTQDLYYSVKRLQMYFRRLEERSGAAEGAIAPLSSRRRFRKGGKRRLLVKRTRYDVQ